MTDTTGLHQRRWGAGAPVIALHPLGLESSGFDAVSRALSRRGLQTVAVDLPGFGRSPAGTEPLTSAVLAAPVIELARALPEPPVVLGLSLGGRVALEIALRAPESVRVGHRPRAGTSAALTAALSELRTRGGARPRSGDRRPVTGPHPDPGPVAIASHGAPARR